MSKLFINVEKAKNLKEKQPDDKLLFGTSFTDHMFVMDWDEDSGWHNPKIMPYGPFEIEPAMVTIHYAQAIFEGLKAFSRVDGTIAMFRPRDNIKRLNESARRMCIPEVDEDLVYEALHKLVDIEKEWVPKKEGTSLYIRPFIFATESFLGVRPAKQYKLMIILSPVGAYYSSGFAPVKILVEENYVRAAKGGTGSAKASGNYAASLLAAEKAKEAGFSQVLWLDAAERKYVEEVGTMNIAFVINNEIVTPALSGSILSGITRDTMLKLVKFWGMSAIERPITIDEVFEASSNGSLNEIFGTGTAAAISAVGELKYGDKTWNASEWKPGPIAQRLYDEITGIQYGKIEDKFGWVDLV